jgi:hypothetical protein
MTEGSRSESHTQSLCGKVKAAQTRGL